MGGMASYRSLCSSYIINHYSFLCNRSLLLCAPRLLHFHEPPPPVAIQPHFSFPTTVDRVRLFCSKATAQENKKINTKVNFSISDSEEEDDENKDSSDGVVKRTLIDKTNLPPPYDPFSKKPVVQEPEDTKDLQQIFHKMRSEGLMNNAVKMFDALSKDGLTHEALQLFSDIKDKGHMPDVVAHTAVIEAYANAGGHSKEALKVFMRMLAAGVAPNAYTYSVLIKGLAAEGGRLGDAKKYLLEMIGKGMRPNATTYSAVFEAFAREEKVEEAREFLQQMKGKGFVPDEKAVRDVINSKRGQVFRTVMNILFDK